MDPISSTGPNPEPQPNSTEGQASALERTLVGLEDILARLMFVHGYRWGTGDPGELKTTIRNQIGDYLLPRARNAHAPLLTVVGGSTGAGKSTLVNSLLQHVVTRTGAVRPTTRTPVLVHHPDDHQWFTGSRILPSLTRLTGSGYQDASSLQRSDALLLLADQRIPSGLALLDAPDIDSIADENRELAGQLLNAADLWIFVTTANRYADAVPWQLLQSAGRRSVTVSVILNRVPHGAESQIVPELAALLEAHGIDPELLQVIHEAELSEEGLIPYGEVQQLGAWLQSLAADAAERRRVAAQTLRGALEQLAEDLDTLVAAAHEQDREVGALQEYVGERFALALERTQDSLHDGSLLRGEILARWQDFAGAGELMRGLEGTVGRVRDRVTGFFTGRPPTPKKVESAIETGLHLVLVNEITKACQDVDRRWVDSALGTELLLDIDSPRPSADLPEDAAQTIRDWQRDVLDMIRKEGAGKRKTARIAAFGVNGLAVALMVLVFASTAGLTGLEVGIAGGSAVVGQKLLEAIFGEDAVRRMSQRASVLLQEHCRALIERYEGNYTRATEHVLEQSVASELAKQIGVLGRDGGNS
ncbi:ABC transporter [Glutamicibacter sp. V16R2B1]|nr:ABC transporter [Glutamicibacter sp. V16R2B1]